MATAAKLAQYNRHLRTFEYMQEKLLAGIERHSHTKEVEADAISKHLSDVNEDEERTWTFN
jgi:transcriptional regulator NrdR family protein